MFNLNPVHDIDICQYNCMRRRRLHAHAGCWHCFEILDIIQAHAARRTVRSTVSDMYFRKKRGQTDAILSRSARDSPECLINSFTSSKSKCLALMIRITLLRARVWMLRLSVSGVVPR